MIKNVMSILAIGDLHIQLDNLADINVFLKQLEKYLLTVKVDLIINLGDTLHTHETVHTPCLNKMLEYIRLCEKYAPTYVLVGNHDYQNNAQYLTDNHPFVGWKKSHNIVDRVISITVKGHKIVMLPYVPDGRFQEALSGEEFRDAKCIFAHQLLNGAKMGAITAKDVEDWPLDFPMVISGHIHDKQHPQPNLYYTGSSIQVSFGEREDHTISLITLPEGPVQIQEINIDPPTKKTVYFDISKVSDMKLPVQENTKLKVSISGDAEEFKTFKKTEQYKNLIKDGVKVVFKQKRCVQANLPSTHLKSFHDILYSLVSDVPGMMDMYREAFDHVEEPVEIVFT